MDGYFFGESIVASAVFNFTDFLRGDGNFIENLVDFGIDVGLAFVWLGIDVAGTFFPLPPCCYPPRPPLQGPFLALDALTAQDAELTSLAESTDSPETGLEETIGEQVEGVDQEEGAPAKKTIRDLVGELVDRFTGEPATGVEEPAEEGAAHEVTSPSDELANGIPEVDEPGTVRAQGQVRGSLLASPAGQSSSGKNGTGPRGAKLTEKLSELARSFGPKKPQDGGEAGTGDADNTGTE
jgi:hypothetical protein